MLCNKSCLVPSSPLACLYLHHSPFSPAAMSYFFFFPKIVAPRSLAPLLSCCKCCHTLSHTHFLVIFSSSCFSCFISMRALCASLCLALSHALKYLSLHSLSASLRLTSPHLWTIPLSGSLSAVQFCQWLSIFSQRIPAAAAAAAPFYLGVN